MIKLLLGDCRKRLKYLQDNSIDSIVTDPPYGLTSIQKQFGKEGSVPAQFGKDGSFAQLSKGFMGKTWDGSGIEYNVQLWTECLRVLKPGGYLLSFGGTRTYHRMAYAIENAGFIIHPLIGWLFGTGFPKAVNLSKMIQKKQGIKLSEVKQWDGWYYGGQSLKPSLEPICMAQKPISEKNMIANVLKWNTGGINVDGGRVEYQDDNDKASAIPQGKITTRVGSFGGRTQKGIDTELDREEWANQQKGRWPSNIILDGSDEVVREFPNSKSGSMNCISQGKNYGIYGKYKGYPVFAIASEGSASRFFKECKFDADDIYCRFIYTPKASKAERNKGCEGMEKKEGGFRSNTSGQHLTRRDGGDPQPVHNNHPTVKPIALMRYLCRLITPPGGIVFDPFMGSGSTGIGAKLEGFSFIGIENVKEYFDIAEARIESWE